MDFDTFITILYVLVDDWFRAKAMAEVLKRRGPQPQMSDVEVLSVALAGQWRKGVPQHTTWVSCSTRRWGVLYFHMPP